MNNRISAFFVLILVTFSVQADIDGLVVRVLDGDTIEVLQDNGEKSRIRLAGIDAPEKKQQFGQRFRQSLSGLVSQKHVYITGHEFDQYNRLSHSVR